MLVALDWLLLVKPTLDTRLVTPLDSRLIDSINIENNGNGLYC